MNSETWHTISIVAIFVGAVIGAAGLAGQTYFGRRVDREKLLPTPPPPFVDWRGKLLVGEAVDLDLDDPLHQSLSNARYIPGRRYEIRFLANSCEWISVGPMMFPDVGLSRGMSVERARRCRAT